MRTFFALVTCVALSVQTIVAMQEQSPGSFMRNVVLLYLPVLTIGFSAVLSNALMSRLSAQIMVVIAFIACLLMLQWVTLVDPEIVMTIGGHLLAAISATLVALFWLRHEPEDQPHPNIDRLLRRKRELSKRDKVH